MQISVIVGIIVVVVGILLLSIRGFRDKIAKPHTNSLLSYVSFMVTLGGFIIAIMEVPRIVKNINEANKAIQQVEKKMSTLEENVSFEEYVMESKKEFDNYINKQKKDFEQYKNKQKEELENYLKEHVYKEFEKTR